MNITNETKIGELVPEGYEVANVPVNILDDYTGAGFAGLYIGIKIKPVKNFDWYIDEYIMHNQLLSETHRNYKKRFKDKDFEAIPFELRIGLLKFICDDQGMDIKFQIIHLDNSGCHVYKVCPKAFIDSLFK
jgi:hypothetical protein